MGCAGSGDGKRPDARVKMSDLSGVLGVNMRASVCRNGRETMSGADRPAFTYFNISQESACLMTIRAIV